MAIDMSSVHLTLAFCSTSHLGKSYIIHSLFDLGKKRINICSCSTCKLGYVSVLGNKFVLGGTSVLDNALVHNRHTELGKPSVLGHTFLSLIIELQIKFVFLKKYCPSQHLCKLFI